jgi:hypothetical protein
LLTGEEQQLHSRYSNRNDSIANISAVSSSIELSEIIKLEESVRSFLEAAAKLVNELSVELGLVLLISAKK